MKRAAFEVRKIINLSCKIGDLIDRVLSIDGCGVSIDGSWQSCGFALLNGVILTTSPDNSKVIDADYLSKFCKGCQIWEKNKEIIAMSIGNAHTIVR